MKRFLLCLLTLALILSATGCMDTPEIAEKTAKPQNTATAKETDAPTAAPTATLVAKKLTIEQQVCFEHEGVQVTAVEVTDDWLLGTGIKFLIENNTDKAFSVRTENVVINHCMASTSLSCKVAAGQKAYETLHLDFLDDNGIENPGQIDLYFYLYDPESYKTVYSAECYSLKTSLFDIMDVPSAGDGQILYDKDGVRIAVKSTKAEQLLSSGVLLYLENNSDKEISVSIDDLAVNGFMVSSFFLSSMLPGTCDVESLTAFSSDLEKNNIKTIEAMTFSLRIYDRATFRDIDKVDRITIELK